MFALPIVLVLFVALARASPAGTIPPASMITPAPALHKRFASDFVGYVLFDDGDTSILECKAGYTYTYTDGYADCVDSPGNLGTYCAGDTIYYTASGSSDVCATTCVTDLIYYSFDDSSPAWKVGCATRTGYKVLHMSSADIEAALALGTTTVDTPTETTVRPTTKDVSTTTVTPTSSSSTTGSPSPPTGTSEPKKNNGALIGGAVAGSLVFLGLVIAGAFFFLAKRRKTQHPSNQASNQSVQGGQSPLMAQDQSVAMSPSPMSPGPFSPQPYSPQPGSFSPPPAYAQEKGPAVAVAPVERKPVQYEYRAPEVGEGIHEAYGNPVNPPVNSVPAPAAYANELPGQSAQPQGMQPQGMQQPHTMPPQGRSELS
ncbi:hypothetical protein K458DRAFT_490928 [Lentithecium fluviatile CBS 122367]|uniref:Uncharacterized protein n=1 Tax=Lentithecium fluviatile CBS 122367 TaxID=1168545 RepID=A0A6G1ILG3_9PLEO|nr:hypothetical protein K458DRAFT_490928 [Lentithecium fluviatile CBS 122367]